ncbi:Hypothetical protein, putative [Bodo saltans]|uniref:Uncharacterized protein n=1 Tax=Bodo saltans TaxID=75058 RepID=A0A0S4JGY7_BODSA|nr:Hypothetical protein, putative [Bodo saltans]|eukprot:CUG87676.1 Hypothetical protein, putative [Bodo saltans]
MPEDLKYVDAKQWSKSFFHGCSTRLSILRNIGFYIAENQRKENHNVRLNDFLTYMTTNHLEASDVSMFLYQCRIVDFSTLQALCRQGGQWIGGVLIWGVLNMTPREWMSCFRKGLGRRDEMAGAIDACVDSRVFRGMRYDESVPPAEGTFPASLVDASRLLIPVQVLSNS